ncbi:MAG: SDR family oxidoreductase [Lachnospiraceae bacterium]|nr:SDR family oxidoreductase [Lachnospiraceae bacterium]
MNLDLSGKKAIVTGGGRGLCKSIAEGFHESGAEVVLVGSSAAAKETAAGMDSSSARVYGVSGDLSDRESLTGIFDECLALLGGEVDILVNGAGVQYRCDAVDFPTEEWERILTLNLSSVFFLSQLAGRIMLKKQYGKIINIASMTSFFGSVRIPAYSASKGGVAQLTKALSNEWAPHGINVNAIAPGYMATRITADLKTSSPEQYREITSRIPLGRWGTGEDLKGLAVFLASDASAYISGAVIPVDGGYLGK